MQPAELVAIMAAIIYSGRRDSETEQAETRQSAVEEAWHLWHLTMDDWTDPGARRLEEPPIAP
jgi:hypothetical protein